MTSMDLDTPISIAGNVAQPQVTNATYVRSSIRSYREIIH